MVVGSVNFFHLERCSGTSQEKGNGEGLDGRKVRVRSSADIWHLKSLCEVQFEWGRLRCACSCPLLGHGHKYKCNKEPA